MKPKKHTTFRRVRRLFAPESTLLRQVPRTVRARVDKDGIPRSDFNTGA